MKKNVASQTIGAQMVTISDGSDFTGTATVVVTIDGGTQTAGGGTVAHEGSGYHSYAPTQAETDGDHIAFTFTGSGAVTSTTQVYTNFPQTSDNTTLINNLNDFDPANDTVANVTTTANLTTNNDKTGYSISGTKNTLDDLNDIAATDIVSAGAITTLSGAVANVDLVDTTTFNSDMRGTDGANTVAPDNAGISQIQTDIAALNDFDPTTDTVANVTTTANVTNEVTADITSLNGDATAASNLSESAKAIDPTTVAAGTITTTSFPTNLDSSTDDFYIGLVLKFTSGALAGQGTAITDYVGSTKTVTVDALTSAPSENDEFVVL